MIALSSAAKTIAVAGAALSSAGAVPGPATDADPAACLQAMSRLCPDTSPSQCFACIHEPRVQAVLHPLCKGTGTGQKYCGGEVPSDGDIARVVSDIFERRGSVPEPQDADVAAYAAPKAKLRGSQTNYQFVYAHSHTILTDTTTVNPGTGDVCTSSTIVPRETQKFALNTCITTDFSLTAKRLETDGEFLYTHSWTFEGGPYQPVPDVRCDDPKATYSMQKTPLGVDSCNVWKNAYPHEPANHCSWTVKCSKGDSGCANDADTCIHKAQQTKLGYSQCSGKHPFARAYSSNRDICHNDQGKPCGCFTGSSASLFPDKL